MSNNMIDRPLLAKRLKEAYLYLKSKAVVHTQAEFASLIGKYPTDVSNAMAGKGRSVSDSFLELVADTFPEYLNKQYLMTGEGEIANNSRTMRPHYEATAAAGFTDGYSDGNASVQFRQMVVGLKDYDFTVRVKGDSMLPRIEEGDVLMCNKVNDRLNPPIGKTCVLDTKEGMVVKEIVESGEDSITVHSLNPEYRDYQIEHTSILGIARVVASIREY